MDNTFARGKDVLLMMLMVFAVLVVVSKWLMVVGWFMVVVAIILQLCLRLLYLVDCLVFFNPTPIQTSLAFP